MTRKRVSTQKEMGELEDLARRQGWRVEQTGGGHLEWTAPDGSVVTSAMTGSGRSVLNTRGLLKQRGMLVTSNDVRRYERARRRVETAYQHGAIDESELEIMMPQTVLLVDKLINGDGRFHLTCVCGKTKLQPTALLSHIAVCPDAAALADQPRAEEAPVPQIKSTVEIPARCSRGHDLNEENLYVWPDGKRWVCKACRKKRPPVEDEAPETPAQAALELTVAEPEPSPDLSGMDLRELADNLLKAAAEALARPTEAEVDKRVAEAVEAARNEERTEAEGLLNQMIEMEEEIKSLRSRLEAEKARADGLAAKASAGKGPQLDADAQRLIGQVAAGRRK